MGTTAIRVTIISLNTMMAKIKMSYRTFCRMENYQLRLFSRRNLSFMTFRISTADMKAKESINRSIGF